MMADNLIERCAAIGTSTWSDAMDDLGIEGIVRGLQQRSGQDRFAAYAVTASAETGAFGTYRLEDFAVARMLGSVESGKVLMVGMGGAEISTFGGMAALAATSGKFAAVVIDGGCRDVDDIRATGLWLASRTVTPISGKRRVKLHAFGEPATIGGVVVRQGDMVVGDATGIVVIAQAKLHQVLERAEALNALDLKIEGALKEGKTLAEAVKMTGYV